MIGACGFPLDFTQPQEAWLLVHFHAPVPLLGRIDCAH